MTLGENFIQGMSPELQKRFTEIVTPEVAKRTELKEKLARLEGQLKSYKEQLESKLPMRKDTLLRAVSKGLAEGEDVLLLRREIREVEQEMEEIKQIISAVERQAIPNAKRDIENADQAIAKAISTAGHLAREEYAAAVKASIYACLDADQAWFDAFIAILEENGLMPQAQYLSGYAKRLLPVPWELRAKMDSWQ